MLATTVVIWHFQGALLRCTNQKGEKLNHYPAKDAHKLNQKGIRTHKGSVWGGNYVYAVIKRHKERLEKTEFRNKKYPIIKSKMWVEFCK